MSTTTTFLSPTLDEIFSTQEAVSHGRVESIASTGNPRTELSTSSEAAIIRIGTNSVEQTRTGQRPIEAFTLEPAFSSRGLSPELSKAQTTLVIASLTGIYLSNSMSTGLFTIGLPRIAADLELADNLLLW
jgi:hypothetical protein